MKADKYRFDGSRACDLRALSCDGKEDASDKDEILAKTAENLQKMAALQDAFYADGREGLIIVLQALDAAGKDGTVKSRIVPTLTPGSICTDPRSCTHYIVTEYGMVNLKGLSTWQRAEALIGIAHPDFREQLIADAEKMHIWRRSNK